MEQKVFDTNRLIPTYFRLALPVVLGSIVTILYNLADTYFIAQTDNALLVAGVSVCSPMFTILMAFGNIYGQGGSSLLSRLLGQNKLENAQRVSAFCFYIAIATGLVLAVPMLIFASPLLKLLGASADTLPYAQPYYVILVAGAPIVILSFIHMNLLRCEGLATLSMIGTTVGAVVNVIFDPILIRVCGWGAAGAAAATVLGYAASDVFFLIVVLRRSKCLSVKPGFWKIAGDQIRQIFSIGITAAITNLASSVCMILVNQQLLAYGDEKIAAMGLALKVNMIAAMVLVGFSFGGVPLFGYLFGAGAAEKQKRLLRFCLLFVCALALVMTAVVMLAAPLLMRVFINSPDIIADGVVMLRWQVAGSVFAGIVMLMTCLFQASGKALPALMLSLSRQGVLFIAVLLIAVAVAGYPGILAAQAIADFLGAALAIALYLRSAKRI